MRGEILATGIHFKTDNETGLKIGKEIGKYIAETWMKKLKVYSSHVSTFRELIKYMQ